MLSGTSIPQADLLLHPFLLLTQGDLAAHYAGGYNAGFSAGHAAGYQEATGSGVAYSTVPSSSNYPSNPPYYTDVHQQLPPITGYGSAQGYHHTMYQDNLYGSSGGGYGSYGYDSRTDNTYSGWGRGNNSYFDGNGDNYADGVDVISRGPRAEGTENQMGDSLEVEESNVTEAVETEDNISVVAPDREQYNQEDFPVDYANAKFFVIKFYGEDDVHKSIKYNVWASTRYGNTKLDAAYHIAQQKPGGCPIFLFFLFVGLAEMIGPVDFKTNVEWQQQDKWKGSFPLKWHIVKDVPNNLLRHITRENNDYSSPVTKSRDTQEVMLEQGLKIVRIFKEHTSKTCILDDFPFYEGQTEEEGQAGKRGEDPLEIASLLL